jgi:hypothetical protein
MPGHGASTNKAHAVGSGVGLVLVKLPGVLGPLTPPDGLIPLVGQVEEALYLGVRVRKTLAQAATQEPQDALFKPGGVPTLAQDAFALAPDPFLGSCPACRAPSGRRWHSSWVLRECRTGCL